MRHARRILQERGPDPAVHAALKRILRDNPDVTRKLRALWALHVTDGLTEPELLALLESESEYLRSWAVYLTVASRNASPEAVRQFAALAKTDTSALVRLYLASALQRVPVDQRWDTLTALFAHGEDAADHNQPLMVWYAAEPVVPLDMPRALGLAAEIAAAGSLRLHRAADRGGRHATRPAGADRSPGPDEPTRRSAWISSTASRRSSASADGPARFIARARPVNRRVSSA